MNKIKLVYIAGPFFNEKQNEVVENIKKICEGLSLKYYSPKDELRYRKDDPPEKAARCYELNLIAMKKADIMVAIIDDFDPGTIFEMGYFAYKKKRILAYSDIPGRGLNLMLAQACIGFANGLRELTDKLVRISSGNYQVETFNGKQI